MTDPPLRAPAMPDDVDQSVPNAARMYDYFLGGYHNFAVDRELADQIQRGAPLAARGAVQNRAWLQRVVTDMLDSGIRQFLDIGSGVPTRGNVHEAVRAQLPPGERATIVYVDYEPVAAQHSRLILEQDDATGWATIVQADMRRPVTILDHPETTRLIDFSERVGLLMISVLHFIGPEDQPAELLATYRSELAQASRLAISHGTVTRPDPREVAAGARTEGLYRTTANPLWLRGRDEIRGLFGDWRLLHYPDLVHPSEWLPEPDSEPTQKDAARPGIWCGVAEKP